METEPTAPKADLEALQLPTVQEAEAILKVSLELQEELQDLMDLRILKIKTQLRASASIGFYLKHGEWDWVIRQRYFEQVRLAALTTYDNKTVGYVFDLWNVQPHNYDPRIPFSPSSILNGDPRLTHLTGFVSPEKVEKCKISALTLEAFRLLKYAVMDRMPQFPRIDREPRLWSNVSKFDAEGYKWHLEDVPPPEDSK